MSFILEKPYWITIQIGEIYILQRRRFFVNFGERCIFVLILMNESNPVYS